MKKLLAIFLALMLFPISANAVTMPQDVDSGSYYANAVILSKMKNPRRISARSTWMVAASAITQYSKPRSL